MASTYKEIIAKARELHAAGDVEGSRRLGRIALARKQAPEPAAPQSEEQARWAAARAGTLQASAESVARHAAADQQASQPGIIDRVSDMAHAGVAGISRGVTGLADLPGMVMGGAGNLAASGMERAGIVSPAVAQGMRDSFEMMPGGDGDLFRQAASDASGGASEFRGDTTAGQYAGTVGEFLPGALMGGGGMLRNALAYGVIPGVASEAAGQLTEGTAAEPWARAGAPILASLLAGRVTRSPGPKAPTQEALDDQAKALYQAGDARPAAGSQEVSALQQLMEQKLTALNRKTPTGRVTASGNVKDFLDVLDDFQGHQMKPGEMQNVRTYLTDAAKSTDAGERRIAMELLDDFDNWRAQHVPEYSQADVLYGRAQRSKDVDFRIDKAERRAASSGTGGNAVNTSRQNIRSILDNPKSRRGYSAAEIEAMEGIVRGTPATNAMRLAGRLSPTSGALPLMGTLAGVGIAPQVAIPVMGAAAAAKGTAELLTNRQISALSELIRNGGPLPENPVELADRVTQAILAMRTINAANESPQRQQ